MAALLTEIEREIVQQASMATGATGVKAGATATAVAAGKGIGIVGNAGLAGPAGNGVQAITAGGTIWTGKGLSLGLGLGLGVWGPILVIGAGAAAAYAYLEYRRRILGSDADIEEAEQAEQDEGFYPTQG